ncbi:MAG TPA: winged helix-turn-helix domain-containing protein [Methanomassiliicoccales archaeon]|nr:winged helix-turn-helix domain-containing protein [Methanomassiliicoccales archaeon]
MKPDVKKGNSEISDLLKAVSKLDGKVDLLISGRTSYRTEVKACALDVMVNHLVEDVDADLERHMVNPCDCRVSCKEVFTSFLQRSAKLVGQERVDEKKIIEMRKEIDTVRSKAPYKKCSQCFEEVNSMFDAHVRMIRSQNSFVTEDNLRNLIRRMDEEKVFREVLDPVANPQRLELMKLLLDHPQGYSALSSQTGLKGGNLLFHLQKLSSTGMVIQSQERGEYSLTDKGNKVLRYLTMVSLEIGSQNWI